MGEKHIHFNEQVEQCIALEMKGEDDEEADSYAIHDDYDSDSDDGAIMMKRSNSKRKLPMLSKRSTTPRNSFSTDSKTIAMLPIHNIEISRGYSRAPGNSHEAQQWFLEFRQAFPIPIPGDSSTIKAIHSNSSLG